MLEKTTERYEYARNVYKKTGADAGAAIEKLKDIPISIHCWQGDDVTGFENAGGPTGGIAATGNYPGKARNADELMADLDFALKLIPGKHRINLHATYAAVTGGEKIERDKVRPDQFEKWVAFAKERGLGLDMNATYFSHEMADDGLTLSMQCSNAAA